MKENVIVSTNYRYLGIAILQRALDDICPIDRIDSNLPELKKAQLLKEHIEKIRDRERKFKTQEDELDLEWSKIQEDAEEEWTRFLIDRKSAFERIEKTRNAEKVKTRVESYRAQEQLRISTILRELEEAREAYRVKSETRKRPYTERAKAAKKRSLENKANKKIVNTKAHYGKMITNAIASENTEKVERRLSEARATWSRREEELKQKYAFKVSTHNHKRLEQDQIRLSVDWFIHDVPKVLFWCNLAGTTLHECYRGVQRRLVLLGRESKELNEVVKKVKAGDYHDLTPGFRHGNLISPFNSIIEHNS